MKTITYKGKTFEIDDLGFLIDYRQWSREFAEALALNLNIAEGLNDRHWQVINFIRDTMKEMGKCPLVYQTCKQNGLRLKDLRELFPTGYLRGACKLAGLSYREGYLNHYSYLPLEEPQPSAVITQDKAYCTDVRGFLINPDDWDESFALHRAQDMKMPVSLSDKHWQIIRFLRDSYYKNHIVPTVYETSEAFNLEIEELGDLFPDGYHRGAVKIAGLRVR